MAVSASDQRHFFDFERQAEQHRYERTQQLNKLHTEEVHFHNDRDQRVSASFWQQFSAFEYTNPTLGWSLQGLWLAVLAPLLSLIVLIFVLARGPLQRKAVVYA